MAFFCLSCCVFFSSFSLAVDQWSGENYSNNSRHQHSYACKLINELSTDNVHRIMDLGCGSGGNIEALLMHFPDASLLAIDPGISMLTTARQNFADSSKVSFVRGSAQSFKIAEKFDLVFSIHVMHWVPREEQLQALKNIYQHLETNGRFAVILSPPKDKLVFQRVLNQLVKLEPYATYLKGFKQTQTLYPLEEYRALLEQAGFLVEYIGYYYGENTHKDRDSVRFWLEQWLPESKYLYAQSPDLHDRFMRHLVSFFVKETQKNADEPIVWREYMLKAVAVKK